MPVITESEFLEEIPHLLGKLDDILNLLREKQEKYNDFDYLNIVADNPIGESMPGPDSLYGFKDVDYQVFLNEASAIEILLMSQKGKDPEIIGIRRLTEQGPGKWVKPGSNPSIDFPGEEWIKRETTERTILETKHELGL